MSFITYSQNFEDLMLWRALKDVKKGFYIDVGANNPVQDSVTKAFYDKNWHGINIEPEYRFYRALKRDRIRDINLNCAVSSTCKEIPLYVSKLRGWSTTSIEVSKQQQKNDLLEEVIKVEAKTLDEIINTYQKDIKEIHFLKIDVEGAEKDVLESFSFSPYRPWIIIVESTSPGTNEDVSDVWESLLIEKDYSKVYFDGVNKYYLAKEKESLKDAFSYPPNVIDDWIHINHKHALEKAQRLEAQLKQTQLEKEKENTILKEENTFLLESIDLLKKEREGLYASRSWKITKPLRVIMSLFKKENQQQKDSVSKKDLQKKEPNNIELSQNAYKIYKDLTCE